MNLSELTQRLTELLEERPELAEAPVLFAHQPHWPLQCGIDGPRVVCEQDEEIAECGRLAQSPAADEEDREECFARIEELRSRRQPIVYLAEASWRPRLPSGEEASPYAPKSAWGGTKE